RLDPRRQEPDACRCRSDTCDEWAPSAEGAEKRVNGALHRPQCRHNLRAKAPELLRDKLDVTPPVADGTPDLLKCIGDARTRCKCISACLRESTAKSACVALERDDDSAHPTCHVRGSQRSARSLPASGPAAQVQDVETDR